MTYHAGKNTSSRML